MAMDPVTLSAVKPVGSPAVGAGGADAVRNEAVFSQAMANAPQAATPVAARPMPEVHRAALPSSRGGAMGQQVLNGIEGLHQGDLKVRTGSGFQPRAPEPVSVVLPPGPAASPLASGAGPERAVDPNEGFEANLRNLKELYDQAVQVSLMTKSTGSFNGTINKLMSAQ